MALLQWRRFIFFDKEFLKDHETNQPYERLKDINISACSSGRGQMIFGDNSGSIHFLDRDLQLSSFKAFEIKASHLYQLKQHNILVSVGEDEVGINPIVRVWNLDKTDKLGNPVCCQMLRAIPGNKPVAVSCLAVLENLTQMAIGFDDGSVVVYRGDITRDRHSKQRMIHQDKHPVTGLSYRQTTGSTILFVVTTDTVISYNLSSKDFKEVLDTHGCSLRCSALSDLSQEQQIIIARNEALYFYQSDGRGPCLAFEGEKQMITWFRGYLVVVSKDSKIQRPAPGLNSENKVANMVTVYDIQNKFIAFTGTVTEVLDVLCEWGNLYIVTTDYKIIQLQEKDTQTKLEILFKKNLYAMAISLAKSQHYSDGLIDIFTQYGDHLYSKGDHDGSIQQYIKTIGHLEPSYVIRKFLDAQRIHNLTAYLQALHEQGLANADHTTLLLNCYTKLKDVTKLDEFIMSEKELNFDVETAIKVCKQAGYYKHAVYLANKFDQHDWYLKIQLEDLKDYQKALEYIARLDFYEAESNMKNYGKSLVNKVPDEATNLLKRLCTDYRPSQGDVKTGSNKPQKARPEEFIHIFVHQKAKLIEFLEHMIQVQPISSSLLYNTLLELYLNNAAHESNIQSQVGHEKKALDLLTNTEAGYDLDHAMVLAQMHHFKAGILYLYEKAKLYQQILHYHMEQNDYHNVIDTCKKYGVQDPGLWVQALSYFARKETDCKTQIMEVLSHIDKGNLMSPLLVLQTLAHNSTATLAVVKEYIIHRLQTEDELIAKDERLIRQYSEETEKMRTQIQELKKSAQVFQGAKCSMCSRPLDLPAVHFLCQHSFHQLCFESYADNDNECPICAPENKKVLDIIRTQEQTKDLHEQFHNQLERAPNGFSVVADYFGRGVFNKVTLVTTGQGRGAPLQITERDRAHLLQ
ncbi:vacuolar protein sorting-associated protein 11 homolog [Actinia tenebrosa]|uniref:Vacuolar protein sorting-associated protein 11 homolog n=1 Tax=Actinia tenebrosa TaxID=6105 RepID=A0A6P8IS55_ACTTE|nr:vacuolar protein sorting-associated protein 11 homolog [Actinia tenebrosa]